MSGLISPPDRVEQCVRAYLKNKDGKGPVPVNSYNPPPGWFQLAKANPFDKFLLAMAGPVFSWLLEDALFFEDYELIDKLSESVTVKKEYHGETTTYEHAWLCPDVKAVCRRIYETTNERD